MCLEIEAETTNDWTCIFQVNKKKNEVELLYIMSMLSFSDLILLYGDKIIK